MVVLVIGIIYRKTRLRGIDLLTWLCGIEAAYTRSWFRNKFWILGKSVVPEMFTQSCSEALDDVWSGLDKCRYFVWEEVFYPFA
jgi:hypothetical protein